MSLFELTDYDRQVYEEELQDFLPSRMIDVHCHIWTNECRPPKAPLARKDSRVVTWPTLVAQDNSVEDLMETYRLMFPHQQVTPLMFTESQRDTMPACDAYAAAASARTGFPALYYSLPEQSADEVERQIRRGHFMGLKSYLDLSPSYLPENEIRIFDFFPREQLQRMNELGAIVMLHIPRPQRLRDPVNLAQILEIKRDFPHIRLIIAHIGRAYTREDVGDAFAVLSAAPDLMFDFSANCCEFAMRELLKSVGPERVMFGSDMPILRMRTRRIEENGTYINLVPPGLYGDPRQDAHLREVSLEESRKITFLMYEEIRAFRRAANALGLTAADVQRAFYQNAHDLIDGASLSLYGAPHCWSKEDTAL